MTLDVVLRCLCPGVKKFGVWCAFFLVFAYLQSLESLIITAILFGVTMKTLKGGGGGGGGGGGREKETGREHLQEDMRKREKRNKKGSLKRHSSVNVTQSMVSYQETPDISFSIMATARVAESLPTMAHVAVYPFLPWQQHMLQLTTLF